MARQQVIAGRLRLPTYNPLTPEGAREAYKKKARNRKWTCYTCADKFDSKWDRDQHEKNCGGAVDKGNGSL